MSVLAKTLNADLQVLVQELSKKNPDSKLVKSKTDLLGIPYSADEIIMMSEVLVYISKNKLSANFMTKSKVKDYE